MRWLALVLVLVSTLYMLIARFILPKRSGEQTDDERGHSGEGERHPFERAIEQTVGAQRGDSGDAERDEH